MPFLIALGLVLGIGSTAALVASSSAAAHPFVLVLLVASVPLVAAGALGRRAHEAEPNMAAVAFAGLLAVLVGAFASMALLLTVVFALVPSVVIVALLAPILLVWPSAHEEEGHGQSGSVGHFAGLTPAAAGHPSGGG